MSRAPLWQITLTIAAAAGDAIGECLERRFGQPAAFYTDAVTGRHTATVYLTHPPATDVRAALREELSALRAGGLDPGPGRIRITRLKPENWAESWKRHFHPLAIGDALLLKPSWSRRRPRRGAALVVLDPGLSFGTGQHATTRFCLEQLVARRDRARRQSMLDAGTGSGILAIAAAKLGYAPVHAFDFDPEAVRVARANARQNAVATRLRLTRADVTRLPRRAARRYDVVCANLLTPLLVAERERLVNRLAPGGVLVLAGILHREFAEVRRAYEAMGLKLIASRRQREWRSGAFTRRPDVTA